MKPVKVNSTNNFSSFNIVKFRLKAKYKSCLFVIGSILKHLKQRSTGRCEPFMKPGANPEDIRNRFHAACGCIWEEGRFVSCRDIGENGGCKPIAAIDCKKGAQEWNDIWIEGEISDFICREMRRFNQLLADTCII